MTTKDAAADAVGALKWLGKAIGTIAIYMVLFVLAIYGVIGVVDEWLSFPEAMKAVATSLSGLIDTFSSMPPVYQGAFAMLWLFLAVMLACSKLYGVSLWQCLAQRKEYHKAVALNQEAKKIQLSAARNEALVATLKQKIDAKDQLLASNDKVLAEAQLIVLKEQENEFNLALTGAEKIHERASRQLAQAAKVGFSEQRHELAKYWRDYGPRLRTTFLIGRELVDWQRDLVESEIESSQVNLQHIRDNVRGDPASSNVYPYEAFTEPQEKVQYLLFLAETAVFATSIRSLRQSFKKECYRLRSEFGNRL